MTTGHPDTPIMLSICIPSYSRQNQLAHNLDLMKDWIVKADFAIEIIVSDDASVDETERVIQKKGQMFPHFRYVRQPINVGPEGNFIAAMRLARGKFFVELADDDRLIPEALFAEIAYMNAHEDVIASHAPWLVWSDITQSDHGLFYRLLQPVEFGKGQSASLFNFIISHQVFP